jgi:hypothetical protein
MGILHPNFCCIKAICCEMNADSRGWKLMVNRLLRQVRHEANMAFDILGLRSFHIISEHGQLIQSCQNF